MVTNLPSVFDWAPYRRQTVGFDHMINLLDTLLEDSAGVSNYPPYNIHKSDSGKYIIELALAGFTDKEIQIKYVDGTLTITGQKEEKEIDDLSHWYRGIATRSFVRKFNIADDVVIKGASLKNGLLSIGLEKILPEERKERIINIST